MQNTQFINSVGQMGVRDFNDIDLTADSALPKMVSFQDAYDDGLIELDKPFVVRIALDADNWYLAKVTVAADPVVTLVYGAEEDPIEGAVPNESVVEVTAVLSAQQLNDAFEESTTWASHVDGAASGVSLPSGDQAQDVVSIAYNTSAFAVELDSSAPVGYSALLYMLGNAGGATVTTSGGQVMNGGSTALNYSTYNLALMLSKDTSTNWTVMHLAAQADLPYAETAAEYVSTSTTIDDDWWGDSDSDGNRNTVLDSVLQVNSASAITITLGGGTLGAERIFDIVATGAGAVTISPDTGFTINGGSGSVVIPAQWKKARVYYTDPGETSGDFIVIIDAAQGAPGTELNLITSSADADITAAAGNRYVVDASGYTANRTLTLPTGVVGDKVSVAVTDIADDYSLIITGTGVWGSGEWSRLISTGETVDLLCYSAGNWMVDNDGRIPAKCSMARTSAQTGVADSTNTQIIGFATATTAVGVIVDESAGTITAKRDGTWSAVAKSRFLTDALTPLSDGDYAIVFIQLDAAGNMRFDNYESFGGDIPPVLSTNGSGPIAAGAVTTMWVYIKQTIPTTYTCGQSSWNYPYLSIVETL